MTPQQKKAMNDLAIDLSMAQIDLEIRRLRQYMSEKKIRAFLAYKIDQLADVGDK